MVDDSQIDDDAWDRALRTTLEDAIAHLQSVVFEEGWDQIRAEVDSDEAALRASLGYYEQGLADMFRFIRISGFVKDPVAWSSLKAEFRSSARDAGEEISLRTALDEALYRVEMVPLGDHVAFRHWRDLVTAFVRHIAGGAPAPPAASEDERLTRAAERLAEVEDHQRFHAGMLDFARGEAPSPADPVRLAALDLEERLAGEVRFDLVLNASLRWLAGVTSR